MRKMKRDSSTSFRLLQTASDVSHEARSSKACTDKNVPSPCARCEFCEQQPHITGALKLERSRKLSADGYDAHHHEHSSG